MDFGDRLGNLPLVPNEVEPECNLPITVAELGERMKKYPIQDHRIWKRMHHWLSTKVSKNLISNSKFAYSPGQVCSERSFTLFPSLPKELRCAIWALAVACPRIIELERVNEGVVPWDSNRPNYRPKHFPALWHVCQESRVEAVSIHERDIERDVEEKVPGMRIMRYEHDIFHIKDLNFTISQAPLYFLYLNTVAISWDLVLRRDKMYGNDEGILNCLGTMPYLRVLIILIDDMINIQSVWTTASSGSSLEYTGPGNAFSLYEDAENVSLRQAFVRAAIGPFKEIHRNAEYEMRIQESMARRFDVDPHRLLSAPRVIVRSCALPQGMATNLSGRVPKSYPLVSDLNLGACSI